jgi:RimJ/RimL family protein N-acetyltransferase
LWRKEGERDNRGFWLDPSYWGQGLMGEAADRVTDYAFLELNWPELWLTNAAENVRSARVKERQGAELVSTEPGEYVGGPGLRQTWRLTREAWLSRR